MRAKVAKAIRKEAYRRGLDRRGYRRAKKMYYRLSPEEKKAVCPR